MVICGTHLGAINSGNQVLGSSPGCLQDHIHNTGTQVEIGTFQRFFNSLDKKSKDEFQQVMRHLLINTELGYVLYGEKPVCMLGIDVERPLFPAYTNQNLKNSIYLKRFCELIQNFQLESEGERILKVPTTITYGIGEMPFREVLFINRKNFSKAFRENKALFQYVLGPDITEEGLLFKLLDPNENVFSVVKYDMVLTGILLGYGTQNALFYNRRELLQSETDTSLAPPLIKAEKWIEGKGRENAPGFHHFSIHEERESLNARILPSRNLSKSCYPPMMIFGYLNTSESREIFSGIQKARSKIREVIQGNTLKEILPFLFTKFPEQTQKMRPITFNEEMVLNTFSCLLGKMRKEDPELYDDEWEGEFLRGLQSTESLPPLMQLMQLSQELYEARKRHMAAVNLKITQAKFQEIAQEKDTICIVPEKLYYKVFQEGQGSLEVKGFPSLSLGYYFKGFSDQTHSGCYNETPLENFIPGIVLGVQGMKKGEKRELWIHPEYAYGDQTLDPQLGFKLQLELFDIKKNNNSKNDVLTITPLPCPILVEDAEKLFAHFIDLKKKKAYYFGCNAGYQLKRELDISKVVAALRTKPNTSIISSEAEENLDRFHLSLFYHQKKQEAEKALGYFSNLSSSTKCIHKNRLYLELLKEGKGPIIEENSVIRVRFSTKNHSGMTLAQTTGDINIKETIFGYQKGFLGQKVGSKIRLYIHPEFGFQYLSSPVGDSFLITEAEIMSLE